MTRACRKPYFSHGAMEQTVERKDVVFGVALNFAAYLGDKHFSAAYIPTP